MLKIEINLKNYSLNIFKETDKILKRDYLADKVGLENLSYLGKHF
jgi:hypothetical protein